MDTAETLTQKLLEKLSGLGEPRLREVLDFVDSLRLREASDGDPILEVAGCLSGRSMSAEEIERALYGNDHS